MTDKPNSLKRKSDRFGIVRNNVKEKGSLHMCLQLTLNQLERGQSKGTSASARNYTAEAPIMTGMPGCPRTTSMTPHDDGAWRTTNVALMQLRPRGGQKVQPLL